MALVAERARLALHHHERRPRRLRLLRSGRRRRAPPLADRAPYDHLAFGDADLEIDLARRGIKARKGIIISSSPLETVAGPKTAFRRLEPGQLVLLRQGAIFAEARRGAAVAAKPAPTISRYLTRPVKAETRRLEVHHRTSYRYERPVERSSHLLRLVPVHDHLQSLLSHEVTVSVDGKHRAYEDVFGNRVTSLQIEKPFTELVIEARSRVELFDTDPLSFRPLRTRGTIPVVWMPWQGAMLQPFLLPPELAESELHELIEYAKSFVQRNDSDLLDTLLDLNGTIFKEYQYRQNSTNLATTAFDVYANRRGVCQDFTNLFICLARLLGVPARYSCGYIYTGPKTTNRAQSEASHAWVQVYLPEVGWRGFDPTNGVLTQTDHVRVAVGRNYRDATPTSGTIYVGGGPEVLEVAVTVEPV